jgi:hypothetical protein
VLVVLDVVELVLEVVVGDVVVVEVEVGDVVVVAVVDVDEVVTVGGHAMLTSLDDQRSPARPSDAKPYQRVEPRAAGGLKLLTRPSSW